MKTLNECQSCGMPLAKDPFGGGTYSDGAKSHSYCSYCYENGRFTRPDMTASQMKEFCAHRLHEMGYPMFLARLMVRNLHKLERWSAGAARPLTAGRRA